jgi:hypothetical protein
MAVILLSPSMSQSKAQSLMCQRSPKCMELELGTTALLERMPQRYSVDSLAAWPEQRAYAHSVSLGPWQIFTQTRRLRR